MKKKIFISFKTNTNIIKGYTTITDDGSMVYSAKIEISSFSLYPYNWSIELSTKKSSENRYRLAYCMGYDPLFGSLNRPLSIPKSVPGIVYVELNFPHADGIYYSDYVSFKKKKYFDPEKRILAIGDIMAEGNCIEIAEGQYILIDEAGNLAAVYIVLSNDR